MIYPELSSPAVIVDLDIAERNIRGMVKDAKAAGIRHRPHIKTHKSVYFAKKQLELGAAGITCAKLSEAEVMAQAGIDDIFVAYTLIGEEKLARYDALDDIIHISTAVNSLAGAHGLSAYAERKGKRYRVFIEVDGHTGRGGLPPFEPTVEFARQIVTMPGLELIGLMYFGGDIYGLKTDAGIRRRCEAESEELAGTRALLEKAGIPIGCVSAGSSFSSKHPDLLKGIDEVRAGTYIFNDCSQLSIGMVGVDDCALRIVATVVAKPDATHAVIDAGSKTLTSDLCTHRKGYGLVVGHEEIVIDHLAEEHGFLQSETAIPLEIGDRVEIIPNHVCVVVNLRDQLFGARHHKLDTAIRVDARGCNN
jgi:D-serine deaminase-like pyridoxal phosphate-dependent protein